jgi:hypothetical protein
MGLHIKLVRLVKMCLNETHIKVRIGKHLCDICNVRNCLSQGDDLSPMFFIFASEYAFRMVQKNKVGLKLSETH